MKNYITGSDMLQHSFKVQTGKERHATVTGCPGVNLIKKMMLNLAANDKTGFTF